MAMHGKRGQGVRTTHGDPCQDEQRSHRLSGAAAPTPHYWDRHLARLAVRAPPHVVIMTGEADIQEGRCGCQVEVELSCRGTRSK
jgi:hypothetical protein